MDQCLHFAVGTGPSISQVFDDLKISESGYNTNGAQLFI